MDKTPKPSIPTPVSTGFASADAKRMSFGTQDGMYDFRNSPPLSSFFGAKGFNPVGDPLTSMAQATRRDSLKGMAVFSDFSTD